MTSTNRARDSCAGISTLVAGAAGNCRSRAQSPNVQLWSTSFDPEYDTTTLTGSAASTTSSLVIVAGSREAFVSSRS